MYPPGRRIGVEDSEETPCIRANRLRLRELLTTNIPIQWGKQATKIEEESAKATIWFQDGTSATGDYVVGVDGTWSKGRSAKRCVFGVRSH